MKNYLRRISLKNLHGNKINSYANLKKNVICIVEQISTFNCSTCNTHEKLCGVILEMVLDEWNF